MHEESCLFDFDGVCVRVFCVFLRVCLQMGCLPLCTQRIVFLLSSQAVEFRREQEQPSKEFEIDRRAKEEQGDEDK